MDIFRLKILLHKYAGHTASTDEVKEMFALLNRLKDDDVLKEIIKETKEKYEQDLPQQNWDTIWNGITQAVIQHRKRTIPVWMRVAAAVLFCIISGSLFFISSKKNKQPVAVTATVKNYYGADVAPGGKKATLTLANGSSVVLDSAHNGMLAQQGNTAVIKTASGALAYNAVANNGSNQIQYNVLTTPRGGEYKITLPDGTGVWLNAASSLRFPVAFTGNQRTVELTGEAYFEVAKNTAMPFHVKVNDMDVEDLGTHFNIMAYSNEQTMQTTLLEGKVNVSKNGVSKNLLPGKQAVVNNATSTMQIKDVNTEQVVAWKNGYFRFKETNIHELMRQVERWYDVDVEYKTEGTAQDYTGIVSRSQNISALLQTLELTGTVHFKIEGRKIIVLP